MTCEIQVITWHIPFESSQNIFIEEMVVQRAISALNFTSKRRKKKKKKRWVGISLSSYPMYQFLKISYDLQFLSALYEITIHQLYNQLMVNFSCNYPMKFKLAYTTRSLHVVKMTSFPCTPKFEGFTIVFSNGHNTHSTHLLKRE